MMTIKTMPDINQRITDNDYHKLLKFIRLKVTKEYKFPPVVIRVGNTPIATLGNFSASTGKPKSKKTFNVSAIVASALCEREVLKYKTTLPPGKKRVLYVDTEQSEYHCHKVFHRILSLAKLPLTEENDSIVFLVLRGFTAQQRRDFVDCALRDNDDVGLVVIDGIRDLINDINSQDESNNIINDLMRWSSIYGLHIHTVLHQNKSDDNTRGHLGTELNNKAETILQVVKNVNNPSMSEVKAVHIRDKEFVPFAFSIDNEGLPQLEENYKAEPRDNTKYGKLCNLSEEIHRRALEAAFRQGLLQTVENIKSELMKAYSELGFKRGQSAMNDQYKFLVSCHAIVKEETGYSYNPNFQIKR